MTDIERFNAPAPPVHVDLDTLKYLGLDPQNVATRALVLLAERYRLDPLLGEIQLIDTKHGRKVYVSRDGMLAVAHASGQLDGIEVTEQRRNTEGNGWTAYVSVWRKDMTKPFHYGAQCKDSEDQAKRGNGPEMALARAERRALKRAFRIRSDFYPEHPDIEDDSDIIEATITPPVDTTDGTSAQEVSTARPPAPTSADEWLMPTPEQEREMRQLRTQLGLDGPDSRHLWLALLGTAVGHLVADTRLLERRETQACIEFLQQELIEHAEAIAQAREVEARDADADVASYLDVTEAEDDGDD